MLSIKDINAWKFKVELNEYMNVMRNNMHEDMNVNEYNCSNTKNILDLGWGGGKIQEKRKTAP